MCKTMRKLEKQAAKKAVKKKDKVIKKAIRSLWDSGDVRDTGKLADSFSMKDSDIRTILGPKRLA